MNNDEEIGGGHYFDYSMRTALYVARVIHHDLGYGNAESWSWWRALGGDYRDGLIRVLSNDGWKSGKAIAAKLLWALGNYSRFIRPGARRYDIQVSDAQGYLIKDGDTEPYGLMLSAFKNQDDSRAVVAINYSEGSRTINLPLPEGKPAWKQYRTSDVTGENLRPIGTTNSHITLEPQSITTFITQ